MNKILSEWCQHYIHTSMQIVICAIFAFLSYPREDRATEVQDEENLKTILGLISKLLKREIK